MLGFTENIHAVVIAGNGGIGQEFVTKLQNSPQVTQIVATYRTHIPAHLQNANIHWIQVDVTDESTMENLAVYLQKNDIQPNLLLNCVGTLHTEQYTPEKSWKHLQPQTMHDVFAINAFAVALIGKHIIPRMQRKGRSIFASLSAKVGSIGDNHLGGWHTYRASKTAHNMFVKNLALEATRQYPEMSIVSLHPGTVQTALSAPFTSRYDPNKLFTTERAVTELSSVISSITPAHSGGFFGWDGEAIPF